MRVLITGGQGQLGLALADIFREEQYEVYAWGREELDFTQAQATFAKVTALSPELIIHSGAWTDVQGCEREPEKAYLVNTLGTRNLAVAARECAARLAYISTDFVFDGTKRAPYVEFDPVGPLNYYGRSKLAGEEIVQSLVEQYFIIRTAWVYSEVGKNFLQTMLRLARESRPLRVVADQRGTPTYTRDLAAVVKAIVRQPFSGVYHASNDGECSWYEFAQAIFQLAQMDIQVQPISTADYRDSVQRPAYSVLRNFNLEATLGLKMRDWREALTDCMAHVQIG